MTKYFTERADGQLQMVASDNMQMTDREMLFYVMGRLDLSQPYLAEQVKKHLGVE